MKFIEKIKKNPEFYLFLCSTTTEINMTKQTKIRSLIKEGIDWKYLIKLASYHELIPILYYNLNSICPENVPIKILNYLKCRYDKNVQNNLLLTGELIKILDLLTSNDIVAIPYKGPVLTLSVYKNLSLRYFHDLDILISKQDALKAAQILIDNGYNLFSSINDNKKTLLLYVKTQREFKFVNESLGIVIELQWDLNDTISLPVKSRYFLKKKFLVKIKLNKLKFTVFSPEINFIILCIHLAAHDWMLIMWICDISELINSYNLNWQYIIEKAEKLQIKRLILITLIIVKDLYRIELPEKIIAKFIEDTRAMEVAEKIEKSYLKGETTALNIMNKAFFDFKKRENKISGIKDLINNMIKPTQMDFKELSLPLSLYPLYYLIRPFLLLKRYGKNRIYYKNINKN